MDIKAYVATQLNEEQTKACTHTDTSSLIIAGAGSGKTRVLTYKIAYLVRGKRIPITRILAVTFTNKAANEMKERLLKISDDLKQKMSEDKKINDNTKNHLESSEKIFWNPKKQSSDIIKTNHLKSWDTKWIWTFHSIFLKILKEDVEKLGMKYNKNFWIFDTNESQSVLKDVLKKLNLQDIFKVPEARNFISSQKNLGMDPQAASKNIKTDYDQTMYKVYEQYQKALEQSNSLDFDDLLLLPYMLFKKDKEILNKRQNKFTYILVDEAQDTNRIQFELMRMLTGNWANITMIGDDFQSIYGRRWAMMENFLNVKRYRPDIQMFKLQINYRSKPHIVHASNHIIKNNVNQYQKEIVPHRTGDDKITIFSHWNEIDEAANIIDLIKKMKKGEKIKSRGNIAILYRTNAQSSPFEQLFIQEGIPYKVYWAFKFFERKEIKDVISYVRYLLNPVDNVSLKRILNIPNRKIWKTTIENLEEQAMIQNTSLIDILEKTMKESSSINVTPMAKKWIQEFMHAIKEIKEYIPQNRPAEVLEKLVKKIKYREYLVKEEGGDIQADGKYENIGQLINMAQKYDIRWWDNEMSDDHQKSSDESSGDNLLRSFLEEVALLSDISENEHGDIDAVKLMTVHSSKWLEFPVVFVAGMEDNIFPLSNAMVEPKLLEEERRLMYVAITRAKDVLFLSHAHSRMTRWQTKMNPPSRFLDEIPEDLKKKFDLWGDMDPSRGPDINEGDVVRHKLFGTGYVLEIRNHLAIVKFHNPKFGVRKIETRFLEVI